MLNHWKNTVLIIYIYYVDIYNEQHKIERIVGTKYTGIKILYLVIKSP